MEARTITAAMASLEVALEMEDLVLFLGVWGWIKIDILGVRVIV